MIDFTFYSPTEFIFGKNTEEKAGQLALHYGAGRALVIYGGGSAVKSGLLARVTAALKAAGVETVKMGGVRPNPTDGKVYEGIDLVRKEGVDFIIAVGGGSVIDTAKAIACGVKYEGDFWDFFAGKAQVQEALPVGVVLTIPAAGSEGSGNAVITKESTQQKLGIKQPMTLRPKFAIMNPELTMTLPAWQTASGICDMMVHILERYFTNTEGTEIGDRMCEGVLMAIINEGRKVMENPNDYNARANIMWSGMVAHNGTCGVGCVEDWSGHQLEHEVSAMYDVTHGAGLAVITPAYMTFMAKHNPKRIAQFAERVMGVRNENGNIEETAMEGVRRLKSFLHDDLKLPVTFSGLGIDNPNIPELVKRLHQNKGEQFGTFYPITPAVSEEVYRLGM
ncbi:MAG: iron-containing alcohol dehydrogenase [Prevotellaceae bacterium]|nr:iron-containing alcohol dehydrogenase [Prevotellaceae bacterium]MDO4931387.1 iron-containing alcohol dehydrogenase [Prevotellaceae bacterium]